MHFESRKQMNGMNDALTKFGFIGLFAVCFMSGCVHRANTSVANSDNSKKPTTVQNPISASATNAPKLIYLSGRFSSSGAIFWKPGITLAEAINAGGGHSDAPKSRIMLIHSNGQSESFRWNTQFALTNNPVLEPGDTVMSLPPPVD